MGSEMCIRDRSDREFEKPPSKGLYVAFKYTIIEKETEVQIESEQL